MVRRFSFLNGFHNHPGTERIAHILCRFFNKLFALPLDWVELS
jgi:hypothetical protein